ncbi:MAG: AAA family ATPase [Algicola sp.]|nr:AAA family ATPase [Algicola sp.]
MKTARQPKVIAFSGASGCGKTTLIKKLAAQFKCPYVLFDDHANQNTYPQDMKTWLEQGADVTLISSPTFAPAINAAKTNNPTAPFVFIEEPFGKQRPDIAELIDNVILLDVPLSLCLARIIKRRLASGEQSSIAQLPDYLDRYESHLREVYLTVVNQVRLDCDFVLDELCSVGDSADRIAVWLRTSKSPLVNPD